MFNLICDDFYCVNSCNEKEDNTFIFVYSREPFLEGVKDAMLAFLSVQYRALESVGSAQENDLVASYGTVKLPVMYGNYTVHVEIDAWKGDVQELPLYMYRSGDHGRVWLEGHGELTDGEGKVVHLGDDHYGMDMTVVKTRGNALVLIPSIEDVSFWSSRPLSGTIRVVREGNLKLPKGVRDAAMGTQDVGLEDFLVDADNVAQTVITMLNGMSMPNGDVDVKAYVIKDGKRVRLASGYFSEGILFEADNMTVSGLQQRLKAVVGGQDLPFFVRKDVSGTILVEPFDYQRLIDGLRGELLSMWTSGRGNAISQYYFSVEKADAEHLAGSVDWRLSETHREMEDTYWGTLYVPVELPETGLDRQDLFDQIVTAIQKKSGATDQEMSDLKSRTAAYLGITSGFDAAQEKVQGGVDFVGIAPEVDAAQGMRIEFDMKALQDVFTAGFEGFTPELIRMVPIASPLPLLGVKIEPKDEIAV